MNSRTILVLGGAGRAGLAIADLLLRHTDAHVILAGRNESRLRRCSDERNAEYGSSRCRAVSVDATDTDALAQILPDCHMLVVAAPLSEHAHEIARTALDAGIDYLDLYVSYEEDALTSLSGEIAERDLCFITQAGSHPGMAAPLLRYAATRLDSVHRADVSQFINLTFEWSDTVYEFARQLVEYDGRVFDGGAWRKAKSGDYRRIDFGDPYGSCYGAPLFLSELEGLPERLGMEHMGMSVAGFNWFVNYVALPIGMALHGIKPGLGHRQFAKLLLWGVNRFSKPPFGTVLQLDAQGAHDGVVKRLRVRLAHDDPYATTTAPVVACLMQYFDGSLPRGLHLMGQAVDPVRLLRDVDAMGLPVEIVEE